MHWFPKQIFWNQILLQENLLDSLSGAKLMEYGVQPQLSVTYLKNLSTKNVLVRSSTAAPYSFSWGMWNSRHAHTISNIQYPIIKGAVEEWLSLQRAQVALGTHAVVIDCIVAIRWDSPSQRPWTTCARHCAVMEQNYSPSSWRLSINTWDRKDVEGCRRMPTNEGTWGNSEATRKQHVDQSWFIPCV